MVKQVFAVVEPQVRRDFAAFNIAIASSTPSGGTGAVRK
jgi:hypothetical protein